MALQLHREFKAKACVEFPAVMSLAAVQTGNGTFDWAHPRKISLAIWTFV